MLIIILLILFYFLFFMYPISYFESGMFQGLSSDQINIVKSEDWSKETYTSVHRRHNWVDAVLYNDYKYVKN